MLDVAAGNGNATLAAARRGCIVTSTDYVASLLERGRERAQAERLEVAFQQADVEALPFADASFDAVLSTFGAMFAPDQARTASEMARVCRPGGKIAMANWTPDGSAFWYRRDAGGKKEFVLVDTAKGTREVVTEDKLPKDAKPATPRIGSVLQGDLRHGAGCQANERVGSDQCPDELLPLLGRHVPRDRQRHAEQMTVGVLMPHIGQR